MPRDFVKYGYDSNGFASEFGDIKQPSKRDRSRLFTMLDQLEDWFGHGIYEKRIDAPAILDADADFPNAASSRLP